jgi:hypothetical protein
MMQPLTGKIVVYTAIADAGIAPPVPDSWLNDADFVVFQDHTSAPPGWQCRPLQHLFDDPCRNVLHHKILAHRYFPQAHCTLWIDPSVQIISCISLRRWLARALATRPLAAFPHLNHNCCYQEAADCIQLRLDSSLVIDRQMSKYHARKHPQKSGLLDTKVVLRRHTPAVNRFNNLWHAEVRRYSRCDELSLDFSARRARLTYAHLPGSLSRNCHFQKRPSSTASIVAPACPPMAPKVFEKPHAIILSVPRSGTHFLQASLASHPRIFSRDEFLVRYANNGSNELDNLLGLRYHAYANKPSRLNIGIIMYENIQDYESFFGPLTETKIIHLLRNPLDIALSCLRMETDRKYYQNKFRKHYLQNERPLPHRKFQIGILHALLRNICVWSPDGSPPANSAPSSFEEGIAAIAQVIETMQSHVSRQLASHPDILTVNYDEITGNTQVNRLPKPICVKILDFLDLEYRPLTNNLRKTG